MASKREAGGESVSCMKRVLQQEEPPTFEEMRAAYVLMFMANWGDARLGPNYKLDISRKKMNDMTSDATSEKMDVCGKGKEKVVYSDEGGNQSETCDHEAASEVHDKNKS